MMFVFHRKQLVCLIIMLYMIHYDLNFALRRCILTILDHCHFSCSGQEEEMMRKLVHWGPLAVTVDAISWQDYLGGIIQYHCSSGKANHAVLVTGFDRTGKFYQ